MAVDPADVGAPRAGSDVAAPDVVVALPHQLDPAQSVDPVESELAAAVDEAVIGDVLADLPEARPDRPLHSATDFSSIYIRHRAGMATHARRFLRDQRDVDEVVQETFLRLFLAINEIDTELQAIAFARRTLTNLCIDRYRAERRRPTLVALDTSPVVDVTTSAEEPDPVLQAEDAAIVREALARLSPMHRAALVKREIEEKTLPQIAEELGVAEESVKHLLFRARRALRRLLVGTSVEPGIDLSPAEIAGIANRRLARGMMQGANVLIVLFVSAVVAAVGVRPLLGHPTDVATPVESGEQAGSAPSDAGSGEVPPATGARPNDSAGHHASGHHASGRHAMRHAAEGGHAPAPVEVTPPVVTPPVQHHHAPSEPPSTTGRSPSSRAHLRLSGPLKVTGAPQLVAPNASSGPDGSAGAASSFTAPTDQGTFVLNQAMTTSDKGTFASVSPSFVVGGVVERPTITGSSTSVETGADGNLRVTVTASAQPDYSTNAFPLSSVTADLVMSPDLSRVISEEVVLAAQLNATHPDPTAPDAGHPAPGASSAANCPVDGGNMPSQTGCPDAPDPSNPAARSV
ncbi:MAG TPA: RNA polymerase sigma factor [Mycobacteriales bacterium]|nr:RNA polymerase sigma factor [Mycobacteriales bacterium]